MNVAGYIVALDWVIYGYGHTEQEAEARFDKALEENEIVLVDRDTAVARLAFGPQYMNREDKQVLPATEALLKAVEEGGGSIMWAQQGGTACLPRETET